MASRFASFAPLVAATKVVFCVTFGVVFGTASCRSGAVSAPTVLDAAAALKNVQTSPIADRPMPVFLVLTGSLRANEESNIGANASGRVLQVFVERGQSVKKGDVIVTLDARGAVLSATAAEAQSKLAESQLEQAKRECDRVKHLLETGAISQAEYDRQTSQCTSQQWSAAAAQAQQQSATKLLGDTRIRAPFDGIIGERVVNVGQYVDAATRVATIYQADPLRLQLTVPEANVGAIAQDMSVDFTVTAFADQTFSGAIKYISPNVREASRDLIVEAVVPNHDRRLRPGMFAVARLALKDVARPVVPVTAVAKDDVSSRVFVVGPDKVVEERLVQLGEQKGDVVAVLGGVRTGETLVLQPGPDVRDGARVE